ncbi:U4/U6 small nuclear ribonucleoprotein prp4 [Recurvomyces mirabilis]|uniref:non-specific serine/threonine protein kinase n=1 Tax=Recurvomyces mirabilis TaxID=574656 RepID=A0AAE1C5W8_9PEZI|nr:U4/U6 small nuclear ribonucleoprotein prp4 [Recurvomyces mirabilis]KAK5158828.1 U4/U6 small nuclear ribonucleoprotein prp4 [Recurvomyces mirabilis]
MSLRSRTNSPALSDGEVLSGDEEKAISTKATTSRNSTVNTSARSNGSSSRASRFPYGSTHPRHDGGGAVRLPESARDRSRSPYRKDRSRSPYHAKKGTSGEKRSREDDHYDSKNGSDPRRFKIQYEDEVSQGALAAQPAKPASEHHIPSRPVNGASKHQNRNDGVVGMPDRGRDRARSRSPFRHGKEMNTGTHNIGEVEHGSARAKLHSSGGATSVKDRESTPPLSRAEHSTKVRMSLSEQTHPYRKAQAQPSRPLASTTDETAENDAEQQPKPSEVDMIEQRRRRREAIKAKHKSQPGLLVQALEHNIASAPATPAHESSGAPSEQQSPPSSLGSPRTPIQDSPPMSPAAFTVTDDEQLANRHQDDLTIHEDDGPSAADYDPNMDMHEDRPDHKKQVVEAIVVEASKMEPEPAPKANKEFDMFADDDDDMFAATDNAGAAVSSTKHAKTLDQSLLDNWDYPDGHYRVILGELLDERYAVQQQIGKGTFATVVKAKDERTGLPVAIKIAANNETMYKAGQKEMDFLKLLNESDPEDKKHVIRLLRSFDHKGHMCIVFEALSADLRDVLKKFGRNVGLNLKAIRSYTQQMFLSLSHMKKCQILHADLKPDNILVSERRNLLKVCDLGTAAFATDTELTPYLVSRFYRAPEVILGMPFDYAIDMWSIGCTLFELYTGRILFAGADNNQMLRVIQECRGKIPIRMLKQSHADQRDRHFDVENNFFSQERDKITGKTVLRQINFKSSGEAGKDVRSRLSHNTKGLGPAELKEHMAFVDLLEKCLQLDPARRISPNDALRHGFVAGAAPVVKTTQKVTPAMSMPRAR